ncbi:serinethreonine-protein phosphatase 2a 65 kda regulatory subunit a beta isoform [Nicotiana attenuata]|uniref:Serinethreonine-protein phosphatase 2a 65 kDa regulatory subunit a beta isoform n=1 Tax=Nicotiana attenuata TaxID=49451 RepID=A0A1J6JQ54_NICAT|nr:serinethreonine-protein phosphatase 2a 65 kda regulatory subunit a beta isoform [Nicotiana attenuata]
MQESNSCMISSICRIQSLVQEELQLNSMALDDAKSEEVTVEDTTGCAGIVFVGNNDSDLIAEISGLLDNSKVPPEMLENPIADSSPEYCASLGHQVLDILSNGSYNPKFLEVVYNEHGIDFTSQLNGDSALQLERITVHYDDSKGVAELHDDLTEIVHYLRDPKRCTRLRDPFVNTVLFTGFFETGNTMLARTIAVDVIIRMLLHFPFYPDSDDGNSHDVAKMFDNSFQSDLPFIGCPASESKLFNWFYLVKRLAAGDWFIVRVPACGLSHIAYSSAPDMLTAELRSTYGQMCQEDMPMVRMLVATHLRKIAAIVAHAYLKIDIMSMFYYRTHDAEIHVCLLAFNI